MSSTRSLTYIRDLPCEAEVIFLTVEPVKLIRSLSRHGRLLLLRVVHVISMRGIVYNKKRKMHGVMIQ